MSIYKRGKTYHLDIPLPRSNGKRLRRSAETADRKAAKELHDQLKAQAWRQEKLGDLQPRSLDEAAERYLFEHATDKSLRNTAFHLAFWCARAKGLMLTDITAEWAIDQVQTMVTRKRKPPSIGTMNNYMISLRACMRLAAKRRLGITRSQLPDFELFGAKRDRRRMLIATPAQARALMDVLPPELEAPIAFAFMTGLRKSNVFGLTWDRVDIRRSIAWVQPIETKASNLIVCPLNSAAKALLQAQRRVPGEPRVFPVEPPCWHQWNRYTKRAGLPEGFRFHDIRHTFASWLAMDGVDRKTVQDMGGWKTAAMVDNYVHLPSEHLVQAAERLVSRLH